MILAVDINSSRIAWYISYLTNFRFTLHLVSFLSYLHAQTSLVDSSRRHSHAMYLPLRFFLRPWFPQLWDETMAIDKNEKSEQAPLSYGIMKDA